MIIETPIVGRPVDRETIRAVDEGYLATCNGMHCQWQGLFPSAEMALEAVENHWEHARRNGKYHYGARNHVIVALLDAETAMVVEEAEISDLEHEKNRYEPDVRDDPTFPRTNGDLEEIASTGDLIELPGDRQGKVWKVTETRSLGLPTWTIMFVDPDREGWPNPETEWVRGRDQSWLNEMIAVDGTAVMRYCETEYPIVGRAEEFQTMIGGFDA